MAMLHLLSASKVQSLVWAFQYLHLKEVVAVGDLISRQVLVG